MPRQNAKPPPTSGLFATLFGVDLAQANLHETKEGEHRQEIPRARTWQEGSLGSQHRRAERAAKEDRRQADDLFELLRIG